MRLTPYPAYKPHAAVGLISAAHQATQRTKPDAANALSGLQRHAAVGLISAAHQAVQRPKPDAANALSGLQTMLSQRRYQTDVLS